MNVVALPRGHELVDDDGEAGRPHARASFLSGKDDAGWCARVWDAYVRDSRERGFVDEGVAFDRNGRAFERKGANDAQRVAMGLGRKPTMKKSDEAKRDNTVAVYRELEKRLDRAPTCVELGEHLGISAGAASQRLAVLRRDGAIPRVGNRGRVTRVATPIAVTATPAPRKTNGHGNGTSRALPPSLPISSSSTALVVHASRGGSALELLRAEREYFVKQAEAREAAIAALEAAGL